MDNKMKMDGDSQFFSYYNNTRRDIEPLLPDVLPSVLEIGCGAGETMKWLRSIRTVHYAAGVELSPDAASVAQSVFDTIEIADIRSARLEFERGRFAAVLALDVLEHLPDPSAVVHRLKHKIAPDGVFIASIPNISHYTVSFPLFFNGSWDYTERGLLDKTHLQFFTRKSVIRLFEGAGF